VIDQGAYSLVALAVTVAAAHITSQHELATFTVALAAYYMVLAIARTLTTSPAIVMYGGDKAQFEVSAKAIRTINLCALIVCAISMLWICAIRNDPLLAPALIVAFLPQLILDVERYLLVGSGEVGKAAFGGFIYLALLGISSGIAWSLAPPHLGSLLVAWGLSASCAALALWRSGVHGGRRSASLMVYLRSAWTGISALTIESIVLAASTQAVVFILAAYKGDAGVVGYRLAISVVLGPWTTLLMGVMPQCQILIRRWALHSVRRALPRVSFVGCGVVIGSIVVGLAARWLPTSAWRLALGPSWPAARASLWWAVAVVAATSGGGVWWMFARYPFGIAKTSAARSAVTGSMLGLFWVLVALGSIGFAFYVYSSTLLAISVAMTSLVTAQKIRRRRYSTSSLDV
jgi:hypothetical protein